MSYRRRDLRLNKLEEADLRLALRRYLVNIAYKTLKNGLPYYCEDFYGARMITQVRIGTGMEIF